MKRSLTLIFGICLFFNFMLYNTVAVNAETNSLKSISDGYRDVLTDVCGGTLKMYTDKQLSIEEIDNYVNYGEYGWWKFDECNGIYQAALLDMDSDGTDELIFTYARGEFVDAAGRICPVGKNYIYTMENGSPLKIFESEEKYINGYSGGYYLGYSCVGNVTYVIMVEIGTEGAFLADYYIYSKNGNSIDVYKLHSCNGIIGDVFGIEYSITKNGEEVYISESEFVTEAEKYMKYCGIGIKGQEYSKQITFEPFVKIERCKTHEELDNILSKISYSDISVLLNGNEINFETYPYIENGVTMVPIRAIFEALGAEVYYDAETKTIMASKGNTVVELVTGSENALINGERKELSAPIINKNGSTMVPLRFVSEALGAQVNWDTETKTITIKSE